METEKIKLVKKTNWLFLIIVLTYLGMENVLGLVFKNSNMPIIYRMIVSQLLIFTPAFIYLVINKNRAAELLRFHKIKWINILLLIVLTYLLLPLIAFLNSISLLFTDNKIEDTMIGLTNQYPYLLSVILIALMPCVVEEIVFRGTIYGGYRKANMWKGIVLSGFIFGLMHMNLNQFMYAFVLGMILCIINEATGSLVSSMIVHFVFNANSISLMYILPYLYKLVDPTGKNSFNYSMMETSKSSLIFSIGFYGMISVATTTLAVLLLIGITKIEGRTLVLKELFHREKMKPNQVTSVSFSSIPLYIGFIIGIGYMILIAILK